ncbi:hypothetical protein P9112_014054 [Eukaryota sp. TZLM1-RC]
MSRLYAKGLFLGFKRNLNNQDESVSLVKIDGVNTVDDARWYEGKRVAFLYNAKNKKEGKTRIIWGKVVRPHGNSGVVRCRFRRNLPPRAIGAPLRIMMYPHRSGLVQQ